MTLRTRVEKLETAERSGRVVVVWKNYGETEADTLARWHAEHPGETLNAADTRVNIVRWAGVAA